MLRLVLPKGSLENATLELFLAADLAVRRSSDVDYRASIDDPRVSEVRILRPQEIPVYVAEGLFDIGITGRDWIEETGAEVVSLGQLQYSKATSNPIRVVVAGAKDRGSPRRGPRLDGVPGPYQALLHFARHRRRRTPLLRGDRSQDSRD